MDISSTELIKLLDHEIKTQQLLNEGVGLPPSHLTLGLERAKQIALDLEDKTVQEMGNSFYPDWQAEDVEQRIDTQIDYAREDNV